MAREVKVSILVDDNGTMRLTEKSAKKLGSGMERVGKSAASADRQLKGAAQASSNTSKNFSKMAQGITGGLVPAYATFAANVFAVTAVLQAFKNAADVTNLIEGQKALGAVTGVAYGTITNALRDATNGMLSFKEAASAAAIGTSAGLSSGQLEGLASAAKNASAVLGRDLTDSFNRLVRGVTKAEPELLDELGIILRLEDASKKYAEALGINARELTTFEKQQAVANEVLGQAEEKYGKIAEIIDPAGQAVNRLTASFDQLLLPVQQIATKGFAPVFNFLSENLLSFGAILTVIATSFVRAFTPAIPTIEAIGGSLEDAGNEVLRLGNTSNKTIKKIRETGRVTEGQLKILEKAAKAKNTVVLKGDLAERRQLLRSIAIINAAQKTALAEQKTGFARYFALISAGYARVTADAGKFIGTLKFGLIGLGKALNALPFIGLGFLLVDLGKELFRYFNPIPEAIEKANNSADKFISTSQQLNEELERSLQIRNDVNLSLEEYVTQLGNAIASSDIIRRIKIFENLGDADPEKKAQAFKELTSSIDLLVQLDSRFAGFREGLAQLEKTGAFPAVDELSKLVSKIVEAGVALQRFEDTTKKIQDSIKNAIGVKAENPFFQISDNIATGLKDADKFIPELQSKLNELRAGSGGVENERKIKKDALEDARLYALERAKALRDARNDPINQVRGRVLENKASIIINKRLVSEANTALEQARAEFELADRAATENAEKREQSQKDIERYQAQVVRLTALQTELGKVEENIIKFGEKNLAIEKKLGTEKTKGILSEEKVTNLRLEQEGLDLKVNDALRSQTIAKANLAAIDTARQKDAKSFTDEERRTAQSQLDQADARVAIAERERDIQKELLDLKIIQAGFEDKRAKLAAAQARSRVDSARANLGVEIASSGVSSFGVSQARAVETAQQTQLQARIEQAKIQKDIADNTYRENALLFENGFIKKDELMVSILQQQIAQTNLEKAQLDLDIAKQKAQISLNSIYADTEKARLQSQLSYISAEQAKIEEQVLEYKLANINATPAQIEAARTEFEKQQDILRVLEAKKSVVDTFNNSLQSGIEGLIEGTMSLKDAFKNMAVSILKELSSIIARMLVMRALGTPFFGGFQSFLGNAGATISARNGGVFSNGKQMSYDGGGIAKGSTSGYPAILHGTEAVVPLPDGKSIPVAMQGGANTNNVTVNVSMDGSSSSQAEGNSQQGLNIGRVIAGAVQEELQRQKRPGGILSPYGAA